MLSLHDMIEIIKDVINEQGTLNGFRLSDFEQKLSMLESDEENPDVFEQFVDEMWSEI